LHDDAVGAPVGVQLDDASRPALRGVAARGVVQDVHLATALADNHDAGLVALAPGRASGVDTDDDAVHRRGELFKGPFDVDAALLQQVPRPQRALDIAQDLAVELLAAQ